MGDCWSFALMRGMLSLQCTRVPCYPLPRTRIIERRDLTGQLAHESDFEPQERGFDGISLTSYVIKDSVGNQYAKMNWTKPFMNPNQLAAIKIIIDGSTFTFQPKNTYTIALTTTRSNIFTFTITA